MLSLEVKLPSGSRPAYVRGLVEKTCRTKGLKVSVKTSLVSYPGSTHWHFKRGVERGTVEVTYWMDGGRLWISVHDNRTGAWTTDLAKELKSALESRLGAVP